MNGARRITEMLSQEGRNTDLSAAEHERIMSAYNERSNRTVEVTWVIKTDTDEFLIHRMRVHRGKHQVLPDTTCGFWKALLNARMRAVMSAILYPLTLTFSHTKDV